MKQIIRTSLEDHLRVVTTMVSQTVDSIDAAIALIVRSLGDGGKLLIFGNGGSAADSQHLAAELVGRYLHERRAIPALALTTDTSILTAVGNDYGFERIFSRQIEALATNRDVLLGISTSGTSHNVLRGFETGRTIGCSTIALTGGNGAGTLGELCDCVISVPSHDTPRIQEGHGVIIHLIAHLVEQALMNGRS